MIRIFAIKFFPGPPVQHGGAILIFRGCYFEIGGRAANSWWRRSRRVTLPPKPAARRRSINTGSLVRRPSGDAVAALTPTKWRRLRPCAPSVKWATFGSDPCTASAASCNFNAQARALTHTRINTGTYKRKLN